MATANEEIRDALIKRQIQLIKESGAASRDIKAELEGAFKELKDRIDRRLRRIIESGADSGPSTTKRLLALEEEIRAILRKPNRNINKRVRDLLSSTAVREPRVIKEVFRKKLPVVVSFGLPSAKQLREIVDNHPVDGTPIGKLLEKFAADNVERIMAAVRRGLTLGESIAAIVRRLRKALDIGKRAAEGIARTAANAIANRARQEMFRQNKDVIQSLVWVATLDDRTCPYCGAQDGKRFPIEKGPRPPAHISCRCLMVASIDGKLIGHRPLKKSTAEDLLAEYAERAGIKPVKSRASLPRGHKGKFDRFARKRVRQLTGRVPASETFDEFLRKQSPAFQNKVLREQVAKWYRQRKVDLEDLFDDNGDIFSIEEILRRRPDLRDAA